MKVTFETLGCKVNQAETELLARQFIAAGHELVSSVDDADIYILNTCTVTHIADRKSRHLLRMARRRNPNLKIIATGCYAQRARQELAQISGVSFVAGNDEKSRLLDVLELSGFSNGHEPGNFTGSGLRTRAFIKIQDGCSNFCTYCVVPQVRGSERSMPADQVISEIKSRVKDGYKEAVITGVKVGVYSNGGLNLSGLLQRVLAETDVARLRLSSLQPQEITPELIKLWQDPRLCRHFHLSLQSGSDTVLKRMNRRYSASDYEKAISLIRAGIRDVAITTDSIVGFPGETDAEFQDSLDFCRRIGFARIHVFPYSPRSGTAAAKMTGQVDEKVKKQRSETMLALARTSMRDFRQRFVGRTMPVLWETQTDGLWSGLTDNYLRVFTRSSENLENKITVVKVSLGSLEVMNE